MGYTQHQKQHLETYADRIKRKEGRDLRQEALDLMNQVGLNPTPLQREIIRQEFRNARTMDDVVNDMINAGLALDDDGRIVQYRRGLYEPRRK